MSADPAPSTERRTRADRRAGERRAAARRTSDTVGRFSLIPAVWALVGALVVGYVFFMALGNVRPGDAPVATWIAVGLGVLWLVHAWRRVFVGANSPPGDRERRGF